MKALNPVENAVCGTACLLATQLAVSLPAQAQAWPSKPISIVVPFSAGGPTDTLARIMSEPLRRFLGQTIVVDNVTGAGGSIGVGRVVRSAPDGYTLSLGHWGTHVVNGAYYNLSYDLLKDMAPVAKVATNPQLIVSKPGVPAKDLKELIAWMKANSDKFKFATGGVGGSSHIAGVYFLNRLGMKTEFIPYRGGAPALNDVLAGTIPMTFATVTQALPQYQSGLVRALGVTTAERHRALPNVPTFREQGIDLLVSEWYGLLAPAATPRDIVMKLNNAVNTIVKSPEFNKRLAQLGADPVAESPEYFAKFLQAEIERWAPVVKASGAKPE